MMRKTGPAGQRVKYFGHPPHVARTPLPTYFTATPDMTSTATSDRHLLKFEKWPKMPPTAALGRILVVRAAFCLPHHLVGIPFTLTVMR